MAFALSQFVRMLCTTRLPGWDMPLFIIRTPTSPPHTQTHTPNKRPSYRPKFEISASFEKAPYPHTREVHGGGVVFASYTVKSSVLRWRPVLSRFYPHVYVGMIWEKVNKRPHPASQLSSPRLLLNLK